MRMSGISSRRRHCINNIVHENIISNAVGYFAASLCSLLYICSSSAHRNFKIYIVSPEEESGLSVFYESCVSVV